MWLELMDEEMREDYLRMQKENQEKQIIINNLINEKEVLDNLYIKNQVKLMKKEEQSQQFKEELEEARNLIEKLQKENESMKLNLNSD